MQKQIDRDIEDKDRSTERETEAQKVKYCMISKSVKTKMTKRQIIERKTEIKRKKEKSQERGIEGDREIKGDRDKESEILYDKKKCEN